MPYCEKHNREKLLSKYPDKKTGEKTYWCPDCYDEWKKSQATSTGFKKTVEPKYVGNNDEVLKALREIWLKIDNLEKQFKEFVKIFSNKQ